MKFATISCSHPESLNCFARFGNPPNELNHEIFRTTPGCPSPHSSASRSHFARRGLISALQEIEQRAVGISGGAHGVIGQDELAARFAEVGRIGDGPSWRGSPVARDRRSNRMRNSRLRRLPARSRRCSPRANRLRAPLHPAGSARCRDGAARCGRRSASPRTKLPRYKKMHRARLAEKTGAELLEYAVAVFEES